MNPGALLILNLKTDADDDVLGFTTDWINAMARHYRSVHVITMCAGRITVAANVVVHSAGKEKGYSEARRAVRFYRILAKVLATGRIRACFAHMIPVFAVMAWPLLRPRRIPIVLWYAHKSVTPILRVAELLADGVVTSTRSGFRLPSRKAKVIGQGIDVKRFKPAARPGMGFRVLSMGRISRVKRIDLLVEALGILRSRGSMGDLKACVVGAPLTEGDRQYLEELRESVAKLGLESHVEFRGSVPFREIHALFQDVDCFVNSSETGSLDKTILEAMSCGIPVISSNAGIRSALEGRSVMDNWLVPGGNADVLAERLLALRSMPMAERAALGARLREEVVENHSLEQLADRIRRELDARMGADVEARPSGGMVGTRQSGASQAEGR